MEDPYTPLFLLAVKLVITAAVLERAVGQIKNLARMDWAHPWPVVSLILSLAFVFGYDLATIETIVGHTARIGAAGFLDRVATAFILSGGAAGIIDLMKKIAKQRDELHEIRKTK